MIKQNLGEATITGYKKAGSTVFAFNDVVTRDSSGYLVRATASTPRSELLGLIQTDVLATDTDYASNTLVPVALFDEEAEFLATVDTGSAVQAMVGKRYDLNDHNGINVNAELQKAVEIVKVISTTSVVVRFITSGDKMRLVSYQQTLSVADFTDGGGASGTLDLTASIPAGAVFAQTMVKGIVGFAGDTSAVIVVGDGTDADRYNTGTPTVFTTAPAGVDMGVPSGTKFHATAKTPKVTITSATDFGLVVTDGNGAVEVTLFWYEA